MELKNKHGFFYFVELMIILIVVSIILTHFPIVQKSNTNFQQHENLRQYGFGVMRALDDVGILSTYINTTAIGSTNFTALRAFTQASFPETIKIQLEYIVNSTTCYNQHAVIWQLRLKRERKAGCRVRSLHVYKFERPSNNKT